MSTTKNNGPIIDPALCRLCRMITRCRLLTVEYTWMDQKEIYADMVMECFGILLSHIDECEKDTGVCDNCVVRLRDNSAFRKQVLQCEELFLSFKLAINEGMEKIDKGEEIKQLEGMEVKVEPKDYISDHNSMDDDREDGAISCDYSADVIDEAMPKELEDVPILPPLPTSDMAIEPLKSDPEPEDPYQTDSSSNSDKPLKRSIKKVKRNGTIKKKKNVELEAGEKKQSKKAMPKELEDVPILPPLPTSDMAIEPLKSDPETEDPYQTDSSSNSDKPLKRSIKKVKRNGTIKKKKNVELEAGEKKQSKKSGNNLKGDAENKSEDADDFDSPGGFDSNDEQNSDLELENEIKKIFSKATSKKTEKDDFKRKTNSVNSETKKKKTDIQRIAATKAETENHKPAKKDKDGETQTRSQFEAPIKKEDEIELETASPRTRKRAAKATTSKAKKSKKDGGETSSKRTDGDIKQEKRKKKHPATPERHEHRVNLSNILKFSNATPFKNKTIKGFSCLYCGKYFLTLNSLREHTSKDSEKRKLKKIVVYKLSYTPIKLDVTDLKCNLCNNDMKDLKILKHHLVTEHNVKMYKVIKDIILPFCLEDGTNYRCILCSDVHISFKNLYHHMSTHYRNYCCEKCGVGYITVAALRKHYKTHYQGTFKCDYCDKTYMSMTKKKNHEKGVHTGGWLRNKCPHCPQSFTSYYDRNEHLVKMHNEIPVLYPCNACNKTYKKKVELNRHIRHHHLQQKNFICDICNADFFSKSGLEDHISRHMGGEHCTCEICGKNFPRLSNLKRHLKFHDNQNQFQCDICKKIFMHKSSLKFHARVHQDDVDIFQDK